MALRWKLILALSTMVALSGTAALVALSINSEIRIQIAKIRQTVIEKAPGADDQSSLKTQAESEVRNIESLVQRANTILWSLALLTPAITCFIYHLISHPIGALKKYAQWISQGDFNTTVDLRSQDEFGQLARIFNQMTDDLRSKTVSKDYLDGILKSMVNTLIVLHPDRTIKSVNDATLTMLGYKESELMGQSIDLVLTPPEPGFQSVIQETAEKGLVSNVDVNYRDKQGKLIPMSFCGSTLPDSAGGLGAFICIGQDISETKRTERELEAARQLLEISRQAGMAEVATSVLQNVGNALNSVNVSSELILEKVQRSKISGLTRAVALLEKHQDDLAGFFDRNPKGVQLLGYLSKLESNLTREQKEILEEVQTLLSSVLQMKEMVTMQQNDARVSGVVESLGGTSFTLELPMAGGRSYDHRSA